MLKKNVIEAFQNPQLDFFSRISLSFSRTPLGGLERMMTQQTTRTLELGVQGMTCASCVGRVDRGLNKVEGVETAVVTLATERATVTYDPAVTSPQVLLDKVKDVG